MKTSPSILLLFSLLLLSCGDSDSVDLEQYLVDISKFNMDPTALKDGEKVRIIGASGNITNEVDMTFYNLIVVESLETGKIVNVLMLNYIFVDENNRDLDFISFDTPTGKLSAMPPEDFVEGQKVADIKLPTYDKVLYDTEYIEEDVYDYPTIIGGLGIVTQSTPEELEDMDQLKEDLTQKAVDSLIR